MDDYLKTNPDVTVSPTAAAHIPKQILSQEDTKLYTQPVVERSVTKVDDTPYVPPEKITVRKYRLYKTKGTL